MGLFARLTNVFVANLHALLDKAENPERMLAQIIREMEDALVLARQQALDAVAGERRLQREWEQNGTAAEMWKARARLALANERDDLARRALARHFEHADLAQALHGQCAAARQTSAAVKEALHTLEARLGQARRHMHVLQTQKQALRVQSAAQAAAGAGDPRSPFARFSRLQNRLGELEDDLLIHTELNSPQPNQDVELVRLESDQRIARALVHLREDSCGE